jgi:hypothetical protein
MTKQLLITGALAAAALHAQTSNAGTAFQTQSWFAMPMKVEGAQWGPVLGKPFSGTEVRHTTQTLNDGTRVDQSDTSRFYRDDRGRMRAESPKRVEIFDPVSGFEYDMNQERKTYRKIPIPDKTASMLIAVVGSTSSTSLSSDAPEGDVGARTERSRARRSPSPQVTEELPPQVINGVGVKGSRITMTIPAGTFGNDRDVKVINERWYSDDLQVLVKSSNSDPRFGLTTYELTNIMRTVPDPALFQPPADYTGVPDHHAKH